MSLSWFESLLYGAISGFAEVLPISSVAHQALFLKLVGGSLEPLLQLGSHLGTFVALLLAFLPMLLRMRRERRIARAPKHRRRRQPDSVTMMEIRLTRTAIISMMVLFLSYPLVYNLYERLWLLAIFMTVNAIVVYIPQYLPGANKRAQNLSSLDAFITGLWGGLGVIPGFSRVGFVTSAAMIRGTQRQYAAELGLFLNIPAVLVMILLDLFALPGIIVTGLGVISAITAAVFAFVCAWLGIQLLRYLAFRVGFSGFAYYCWGFALLSLILYLI